MLKDQTKFGKFEGLTVFFKKVSSFEKKLIQKTLVEEIEFLRVFKHKKTPTGQFTEYNSLSSILLS